MSSSSEGLFKSIWIHISAIILWLLRPTILCLSFNFIWIISPVLKDTILFSTLFLDFTTPTGPSTTLQISSLLLWYCQDNLDFEFTNNIFGLILPSTFKYSLEIKWEINFFDWFSSIMRNPPHGLVKSSPYN